MTVAHARNSDPRTSHEAAESVKDLTEVQSRILSLFDRNSFGLTDEQLIEQYNLAFGRYYPATDSSIRSRRSELVHKGKLMDTGHRGTTRAGRATTIWGIDGKLF